MPKQKTREHSGSGQSNGASVSAFSSHTQARADRFKKHLPLRTTCTTWVVKFEKLFHIGHALDAVPEKGMHFMRHFFALCVAKCMMHFSHYSVQHSALICLVCFLSQVPLHVPRLSLGATIWCSSILLGSFLNQVRRNFRHTKRRPSSSLHSIRTKSRRRQRLDVVSKLLCPWSGTACQLLARHARVFVQTCLLSNCYQHSLVRQVVFLNLLCHSFDPAKTSNPEFHCKRSVQHFDQEFAVWLVPISQFLLVIAKRRLASSCWHLSNWNSSFSVKVPS